MSADEKETPQEKRRVKTLEAEVARLTKALAESKGPKELLPCKHPIQCGTEHNDNEVGKAGNKITVCRWCADVAKTKAALSGEVERARRIAKAAQQRGDAYRAKAERIRRYLAARGELPASLGAEDEPCKQ